MIAFGLLDAHVSASAYNNMRIDHYVYTLEALQEARERLADDGILSVAFEAQRPWIQRRLFDLLSGVFGFPPRMIVFGFGSTGWGGTLFLSARDPAALDAAIQGAGRLGTFLERRDEMPEGPAVEATTDDWPYLYLESRSIPSLHLWVSAILVTLLVLGRRAVLGRGRLDLHFFFLGAAFLLLEFQNISKAALLFGSTWLVNALVITAILVLVLLANLFAARVGVRDLRAVYALLLLSVVGTYLVPLEALGAFDFWTRALLGGLVLNLPVFFGGIVFIESFRRAPAKDAAFGSNLLGSVAGGLLESLSFLTGIHALLVLVLLCYLLAWVFEDRTQAVPA